MKKKTRTTRVYNPEFGENEAKTVEKPAEQDVDWREKYCSLLEEFVKLQEHHIAILEKNK